MTTERQRRYWLSPDNLDDTERVLRHAQFNLRRRELGLPPLPFGGRK